ncbi:hypothetical protein H6P81_004224 [Aristolochia fimbriata]|uniref:Uncharacterized protein n=1 Tax=Aristolochia fimbriata TaxID=158543 RepID=A0AAV7FHE2_ARIFI|nr:hypothetical protein H6P81_004224 [Aristolochia fimbriata]
MLSRTMVKWQYLVYSDISGSAILISFVLGRHAALNAGKFAPCEQSALLYLTHKASKGDPETTKASCIQLCSEEAEDGCGKDAVYWLRLERNAIGTREHAVMIFWELEEASGYSVQMLVKKVGQMQMQRERLRSRDQPYCVEYIEHNRGCPPSTMKTVGGINGLWTCGPETAFFSCACRCEGARGTEIYQKLKKVEEEKKERRNFTGFKNSTTTLMYKRKEGRKKERKGSSRCKCVAVERLDRQEGKKLGWPLGNSPTDWHESRADTGAARNSLRRSEKEVVLGINGGECVSAEEGEGERQCQMGNGPPSGD